MKAQNKLNKTRVNHEIRAYNVRLVDEEGTQYGVVPKQEAIDKAREHGLDLVEVGPNAKPPVVKIMDYGKFQYNKKKQEKKNKKKSRKNEVKGIRLGVKTEEHDLEIKKKRAEKFLDKGYKVSIEIMLKGRERIYKDKAKEVLRNFINSVENEVLMEQEIKSNPRGFNAVIRSDN